ncbi:hypothetical protein T03_15458 [Trichinella britovi]|uniref:Uncharacterized protein n=1 Tax=Trichinella britovi TaxID=45882 RepID=A0A0V1C887_TRIBR|nr:hypothetical protein T03_15458 [Trichinella britovi]
MAILQTFNKPGGARRISTPMHTTLLRSPHRRPPFTAGRPTKSTFQFEDA